ncbi:MAG: hypothetical protein IAE98_03745 [Candidatus Kapabacteria bacterium]|nr:hypothetical protein [Candidatus Kapabacteria bacterium]
MKKLFLFAFFHFSLIALSFGQIGEVKKSGNKLLVYDELGKSISYNGISISNNATFYYSNCLIVILDGDRITVFDSECKQTCHKAYIATQHKSFKVSGCKIVITYKSGGICTYNDKFEKISCN